MIVKYVILLTEHKILEAKYKILEEKYEELEKKYIDKKCDNSYLAQKLLELGYYEEDEKLDKAFE